MKRILITLIICGFITGCLCQKSMKIQNAEKINNRNYYLFVEGYSCISNTRSKTRIKSWKNRIEFIDGDVLIYGDLCNDQAEVLSFKPDDFEFSDDLSTMTFQTETFVYHELKPQLCEKGWWCPTEDE